MKLGFALSALIAMAFSASLSMAQVPSLPPGPYNVPASTTPQTSPLPNAVITNTLAVAGTVTVGATAPLQNLAYNGLICTFNQSAKSGTPSTTIEIDAYDAASASYQQLVISGAITANATPTSIMVYPGIQTSSLPTGMVAINLKLPRYYRVKQVIGGTSPGVTGSVGCDLLK